MTISKTTFGNFIIFDSPMSLGSLQEQDFSDAEMHYMEQELHDLFIENTF